MCDFPVALSRVKSIIRRVLKFTGYFHQYRSLPETIFGLILKIKIAATDFFFHAGNFKSAYISLIIGPRSLACEAIYRKSWDANLLICSDLTLSLLKDQMRIVKLEYL